MGNQTACVRAGSISFLSSSPESFYFGDSGGLPGFNGGGVFSARNGLLFGITRGDKQEEKTINQYGDVLEIIPSMSKLQIFKKSNF